VTDKEFWQEIRRGLLLMVNAIAKRHGFSTKEG